MRFIVQFIFVISTTWLSSQPHYLKDIFWNQINKDQFLISQKWSGVDSVEGFSYNPFIYNKKIELTHWIWKTDFSTYYDTTKYYIEYEITGGQFKTPRVEWIDIWQNSNRIRGFCISYDVMTGLITAVRDSDLDF